MNILILNGNPDAGNTVFDSYISRYQLKLHIMGHYVKTYQLRDMHLSNRANLHDQNIAAEQAFLHDDTRYILNSLTDVELLIIASPLRQGHISDLSGMIQSRIFSHYQSMLKTKQHPWNEPVPALTVPMMGIIVQEESAQDSRELLLNRLKQERLAADFNTILCFQITLELNLHDAVGETLRSADYRLCVENTFHDYLMHAR